MTASKPKEPDRVAAAPRRSDATPAPARAGDAGPTDGPDRAGRPRPMALAVRIGLFEREVRERLGRSALDLLFERAECLSEGQRERRGGREVFLGSTMLTFDLPALGPLVRDVLDAGTAQRMAALMTTDTDFRVRVRAKARTEVERLCQLRPRSVETEIRIRAQGARVFVDVDVEAPLT